VALVLLEPAFKEPSVSIPMSCRFPDVPLPVTLILEDYQKGNCTTVAAVQASESPIDRSAQP
jgi:hypothetical protein